jgi:hypothetical protein
MSFPIGKVKESEYVMSGLFLNNKLFLDNDNSKYFSYAHAVVSSRSTRTVKALAGLTVNQTVWGSMTVCEISVTPNCRESASKIRFYIIAT